VGIVHSLPLGVATRSSQMTLGGLVTGSDCVSRPCAASTSQQRPLLLLGYDRLDASSNNSGRQVSIAASQRLLSAGSNNQRSIIVSAIFGRCEVAMTVAKNLKN